MSIETQEILFGLAGQSLVLTTNRPITSVTSVAVYQMDWTDLSTAEVATTGSAAVDTATEATTAAAGDGEADPRKMTVASTTGFVAGRRYLISKGGRSEEFEADRIDPNVAIYARHPLANAYASGATLDGSLRASIGVDATWVADTNKVSFNISPNPRYRVRWVVVHADDSSTAVHERNFDVVRYAANPTVSPIDVNDAFPGWLDNLTADDRASRGKFLIAEAAKSIKFRLYGEGLADQGLRNAEVFADLVKAQAIVELIEGNGLNGADIAGPLKIARDRVDALFERLVATPVLAFDATGAGGANPQHRSPLRLLRR